MSNRGRPQQDPPSTPPSAGATTLFSIGHLAERAGVSPGLLRMWENRFGFPEPTRLPSGHRRYRDRDVDLVRDVVARQQSGLRLEQAIAAVRALQEVDEPSVFAAVRGADPRLPRQRLRKSTLVALSRAIEDEMCAHGTQGFAFGAFQRGTFFEPVAARWRDLARRSRLGLVLADFAEAPPEQPRGDGLPVFVPLALGDPLREEWAVVCDSPAFAAVLSAWERPGQEGFVDAEREYEVVWTLDPVPVRAAGHVCLDIAEASGAVPDVAALRADLAASPLAAPPTPQAVTEFCDRVIGQLDERARR